MKIARIDQAPEHIKAKARLIYDEWGKHLPDGSVTRAEEILRMQPSPSGIPVSFIAIEDNQPVGIARLVADDMSTRPELSPWLASVLVTQKYRKKGIGRDLCAQVELEARRLGFANIYLFTSDKESFYAGQGWHFLQKTLYRDKDVVIMRRNLPSQALPPTVLRAGR